MRLHERGKVLGQPDCGDLTERLKVEVKPGDEFFNLFSS